MRTPASQNCIAVRNESKLLPETRVDISCRLESWPQFSEPQTNFLYIRLFCSPVGRRPSAQLTLPHMKQMRKRQTKTLSTTRGDANIPPSARWRLPRTWFFISSYTMANEQKLDDDRPSKSQLHNQMLHRSISALPDYHSAKGDGGIACLFSSHTSEPSLPPSISLSSLLCLDNCGRGERRRPRGRKAIKLRKPTPREEGDSGARKRTDLRSAEHFAATSRKANWFTTNLPTKSTAHFPRTIG